jgi:4'-phosphopantetheinyl transferase
MNICLTHSATPLDRERQRELALLLLDYALLHDFGVANRPEIARTELGKPYFPNPADSHLHFSYSHCEFGAVCVVAEQNIGVDIQPVTLAKPAVIRRVCHADEVVETPDEFTRLWVQKEAFSKFTGRGLAEGFATIDTTDIVKFPPERVFKHGNLYIAVYAATDAKPRLVRAELL